MIPITTVIRHKTLDDGRVAMVITVGRSAFFQVYGVLGEQGRTVLNESILYLSEASAEDAFLDYVEENTPQEQAL